LRCGAATLISPRRHTARDIEGLETALLEVFLGLVPHRAGTPGSIRTHVLVREQARQRDDLAGKHVLHSLRNRIAEIERSTLEVAIVEEVVASAEVYELARPDLDLFAKQASSLALRLAADLADARVFR
jgi:hypothetical protein